MHLARITGDALLSLRGERRNGRSEWRLRDEGDRLGHDLLVDELARTRPGDVVLSEEGVDDPVRLGTERLWIIDPLDGTQDYPYVDSVEWAVHVALVENGRPTAGAVAVPGMQRCFGTTIEVVPPRMKRDAPLVVSGRSNGYAAAVAARAIGGSVVTCGSAGVKAMLVVGGEVDVYVHHSGLYEWDVCAPAAVAEAAGMVVTDLNGDEIVYNKARPIVRGLVVSRPEFAEAVLAAVTG